MSANDTKLINLTDLNTFKSKLDQRYSLSGHTHSVSIAADSGTSVIDLAAGTKYKLTAGGSTVIFKTPSDTATITDNIMDGSNSGTTLTYKPYTSQQSKLSFDTSSTNPTRTDRLNLNGYLYATKIFAGSVELTGNAGTVISVNGNTADANGAVTISIPEKLPNPKKLNIKANSDTTALIAYDGSGNSDTTLTVKASSTNGAFELTNGSTTKTIQLAGPAAKSLVTTISSSSTDNQIPTAEAVYEAISGLPEPMLFKGTLGTGGTITSLPSAATGNEGYTYKVITAGTYQSIAAKVGDVFVSNGSSWVLIPSGDDVEDTWRGISVDGTALLGNAISTGDVNFVPGTGISISGSGNDITITNTAPDTNQKVKVGSTTFGANDTVNFTTSNSDYLTVSGNSSTDTITLGLGTKAAKKDVNNQFSAAQTISTNSGTLLTVNNSSDAANEAWIGFEVKGSDKGYYGVNSSSEPLYWDTSSHRIALDNVNNYFSASQSFLSDYPLQFISIGNGTYNKGILYVNSTDGVCFEAPRLTDSLSGTPTDFWLKNRGGTLAVLHSKTTDNTLYHMGAFDTVSGPSDGVVTITRRTGYIILESANLGFDDSYSRPRWFINLGNNIEPNSSTSTYPSNIKCNNYLVNSPDYTWSTTSGITLQNNEIIIYSPTKPVGIVEYELTSSFQYTEKVIKNQPLNTLDQTGENWVREEWEKSLNKLSHTGIDTKTSSSMTITLNGTVLTISGDQDWSGDNFTGFQLIEPLKANTTYTLSCPGGSSGYVISFQDANGNDVYAGSTYVDQITFTTNNLIATQFSVWITGNDRNWGTSTYNLMLVEGDHPYPYQSYYGEIVRTGINNNFTTPQTISGSDNPLILNSTASGDVDVGVDFQFNGTYAGALNYNKTADKMYVYSNSTVKWIPYESQVVATSDFTIDNISPGEHAVLDLGGTTHDTLNIQSSRTNEECWISFKNNYSGSSMWFTGRNGSGDYEIFRYNGSSYLRNLLTIDKSSRQTTINCSTADNTPLVLRSSYSETNPMTAIGFFQGGNYVGSLGFTSSSVPFARINGTNKPLALKENIKIYKHSAQTYGFFSNDSQTTSTRLVLKFCFYSTSSTAITSGSTLLASSKLVGSTVSGYQGAYQDHHYFNGVVHSYSSSNNSITVNVSLWSMPTGVANSDATIVSINSYTVTDTVTEM